MLSRLARSVFSQTRTIHTASAPLRSLTNCGETQMRHAVSIRRNTVDGARRSLPSVVSASEAVKAIQSHQTVYVHQGVCAPDTLIDAMVERHSELHDVSVIHLHIEGKSRHANAEFKNSFRINAPFLGASTRKAVDEKRGDFIPVFLSDVPKLYRKGIIPIDVALIQVSPPDRHGFCTLGLSVCDARAAIESARFVIAQINPSMPRVYGDGVVHISDFDTVVEQDSPIIIKDSEELSPEAIAIGKNVASLIDNGSCLQMGIGALPDASLMALTGHKDLGIHTEMFSDKLVDLVEAGAVSGMNKAQDRGKIVSSFLAGSKKLYDFVNENPEVLMLDVEYVNNPSKVALNRQMCAINSCIELDLTGQVCSDSIGARIFSGVGGQVDFMRAAAISEGGKPIMVLNSCTSRGESKIVPFLKTGAGVVTTRAHVHFVVTEFGVADLFGKNLRQRAVELIKIAHPKHREALEKAAIERLGPLL